jgi:hypothetical protein
MYITSHGTHQNVWHIHAHVFQILGWMCLTLPWLPWTICYCF